MSSTWLATADYGRANRFDSTPGPHGVLASPGQKIFQREPRIPDIAEFSAVDASLTNCCYPISGRPFNWKGIGIQGV